MLGKLSIKVKDDIFCDGQVLLDGVDISKHVQGIDFKGTVQSVPQVNLRLLVSPEEIEFSGEIDLTLKMRDQEYNYWEYHCKLISKNPAACIIIGPEIA